MQTGLVGSIWANMNASMKNDRVEGSNPNKIARYLLISGNRGARDHFFNPR
jgi:hypothetical protein